MVDVAAGETSTCKDRRKESLELCKHMGKQEPSKPQLRKGMTAGPVGRTGQRKMFLVFLFYRQVDDFPPWAGKPKKSGCKIFQRLKLNPKDQLTAQKRDRGSGLQAASPRCYGPQKAPQDVNHRRKGLGERSTTSNDA